jgi:glycerol-3-phosphate dehydrogenase (NAD(P)+)
MNIGIIGGGVWGSALAKLLSNNKVTIFTRDSKVVDSINTHHFNQKLKYVVFNENVSAQTSLESLPDMQYIFIALPAQNIREVLSVCEFQNKEQGIIIASKGIELKTGLLLSEVIKEIAPKLKISILSGPCFSDEVAQNLPTAVTFASESKQSFDTINTLIKNKNFRMYYSDDLIGCQIGGALKNIYAIVSGITMGLNLGENAKSAIITRSFVEIIRFGNSMGADKKTIFGLSGFGDLILTCNSIKSRNTNFGYLISTSSKPNFKEILKSQEITEGYFTLAGVYKIAKEKKIDMPIMNSIYNILYNEYSIKDEINNLLERPITDEF